MTWSLDAIETVEVPPEPPKEEGERLFVGNIPHTVTGKDVRALFGKFGRVLDVHIMHNRVVKNPAAAKMASAIVRLETKTGCEMAINECHLKRKILPEHPEMMIVRFAKSEGGGNSPSKKKGRLKRGARESCTIGQVQPPPPPSAGAASPPPPPPPLVLTPVRPKECVVVTPPPVLVNPESNRTHLFVGRLPLWVNRDDLIVVFTPFGCLKSAELCGKSRCGMRCALVNFHDASDAQRAISAMNEKYQMGDSTRILVRPWMDSTLKRGRDAAPGLQNSASFFGEVPFFMEKKSRLDQAVC